jgi:bile-acid 7alpha-dehydratase
METPTLAALAAQVQRLADIEEIKKLKYRYFRCFDMADLEGIAALFHPEVTLDVNGGIYRFRLEGREKFLEMVREGAHAEMIMQHNGHHPEIDWLSPTEARGTWYLQDSVWEFRRKLHITGAALYRDRYLKVDGVWLIKDVGFERIHEIVESITAAPNVTFSYLAEHARRLPPGELADYKKE